MSPNSDSSDNSSDNEPIYKLRRRAQVNVTYRFNEFDDLIDSAIKRDMKEKDEWLIEEDEQETAGNAGRGKDISTIIEADREEKRRKSLLEEGEVPPEEYESETGEQPKKKKSDDESSEDEPIKRTSTKSGGNKKSSKKKKPKRKLNQLDISSEEEDSDDSFKGSSSSDSEEEDPAFKSSSGDTESSLELALLKKKLEKGGRRYGTRRRATRIDKAFINDNDSDDDDIEVKPSRKKKKRSDSEEFSLSDAEDDDDASDASEDTPDVDSSELCDDTGSDTESEYRWSKKKRPKGGPTASGKSPRQCFIKKKSNRDEDRAFRASVSKKKILEKSKRSDDEESEASEPGKKKPARKTRGRQMHYIEDDFESSDDGGIKPGVRRPDTPPEEREAFIRKQEEIKRMLAEKNTEAAKALATPTLSVNEKVEPPSDNISIIPESIIETAKVLDADLKKSSSVFDDLPDDFNPEDMDDEELAKMMEEEDFAQHQLKLAADVIRNKKLGKGEEPSPKKALLMPDPSELPTKLVKLPQKIQKKLKKDRGDDDDKNVDGDGDDKPGPSLGPKPEDTKKLPHQSPNLANVAPPALIGAEQQKHTSHLEQQLTSLRHPMMGQQQAPHGPPHMYQGPPRFPPGMPPHLFPNLRPGMQPHPNMPPFGGLQRPSMYQNIRQGPPNLPPSMMQNPALRSLINMPPQHHPQQSHSPQQQQPSQHHGPPPPLQQHRDHPSLAKLQQSPLAAMSRMPIGSPGPGSQPQPVPEANIPLTVSQHGRTDDQQPRTASTESAETEPVKKRGRRKKITPLRDDLPKNDPSQTMMQLKPDLAASPPSSSAGSVKGSRPAQKLDGNG